MVLFHSRNDKFTYSSFSKTNMKNSRYSKQCFPAKNRMSPFGKVLNLTFKNIYYWTKIYYVSSFVLPNIP